MSFIGKLCTGARTLDSKLPDARDFDGKPRLSCTRKRPTGEEKLERVNKQQLFAQSAIKSCNKELPGVCQKF